MNNYDHKHVLIKNNFQLVAVSHGYQQQISVGCRQKWLPTEKYSW